MTGNIPRSPRGFAGSARARESPRANGGIRSLSLPMPLLASPLLRFRVGQLVVVAGALGDGAPKPMAMLYPGMAASNTTLPAAIDRPVGGH